MKVKEGGSEGRSEGKGKMGKDVKEVKESNKVKGRK